MEIIWSKQYPTGQIYSNGIEMALCSAKNEQIGPFVFCKDFFQDAVFAFLNKKKVSEYSYTYDPAASPAIDLTSTRVLIANEDDPKFSQKLPLILDFLNNLEEKMGIELTKGYV